jgi:hypothetical protein
VFLVHTKTSTTYVVVPAVTLSPEMRNLLLNGGGESRPTQRAILNLGGAAVILVAWRRHREELMAACPAGRRPWGFWMLERRFKQTPRTDIDQARAIRTLQLYANDAERAIVLRRLDAVVQHRRAVRDALRSVA